MDKDEQILQLREELNLERQRLLQTQIFILQKDLEVILEEKKKFEVK